MCPLRLATGKARANAMRGMRRQIRRERKCQAAGACVGADGREAQKGQGTAGILSAKGILSAMRQGKVGARRCHVYYLQCKTPRLVRSAKGTGALCEMRQSIAGAGPYPMCEMQGGAG